MSDRRLEAASFDYEAALQLSTPYLLYMQDDTAVVILSWIDGGPDHPIIGFYDSPRIPGNPRIVSQWDKDGRMAGARNCKPLALSPIDYQPKPQEPTHHVYHE